MLTILIVGLALVATFVVGVLAYRKYRERIERDIDMVKKL